MAAIHHLGCATMCPYGARWLTGEDGPLAKACFVAHVLLIETSDSLVLVDTGIGTDDIANPKRLGQPFRALIRPEWNEEEAAINQIRRLGFDPADVRHIVMTHLDVDHAGGLPDFPQAEVHVFRSELEAAQKPSRREHARYISAQFAHGPKWIPHDVEGDQWLGFESVRALPGIDPEILLVPLVGHSRGHSVIAVDEEGRWLLHCGDAYFYRGEKEMPPECPPGLRLFQNLVGFNRKARLQNAERLRELMRTHGDEVELFCAHDPVELRELQVAAPAGTG